MALCIQFLKRWRDDSYMECEGDCGNLHTYPTVFCASWSCDITCPYLHHNDIVIPTPAVIKQSLTVEQIRAQEEIRLSRHCWMQAKERLPRVVNYKRVLSLLNSDLGTIVYHRRNFYKVNRVPIYFSEWEISLCESLLGTRDVARLLVALHTSLCEQYKKYVSTLTDEQRESELQMLMMARTEEQLLHGRIDPAITDVFEKQKKMIVSRDRVNQYTDLIGTSDHYTINFSEYDSALCTLDNDREAYVDSTRWFQFTTRSEKWSNIQEIFIFWIYNNATMFAQTDNQFILDRMERLKLL